MINFFIKNYEKLFTAFFQHLMLVTISMVIGIIFAFIIIILSRLNKRFGEWSIQVFSFIYAIPSLAFLSLLIPFTGLGTMTTLIILVIYMQFILIRSFITGVNEVDKSIIEAATGIGMTKLEILFKIELPLTKVSIINGIRLALISTISITTIAATINAGGLGSILLDGLRTMNMTKIVWGTIFTSVLVLSINLILLAIEKNLKNENGKKGEI